MRSKGSTTLLPKFEMLREQILESNEFKLDSPRDELPELEFIKTINFEEMYDLSDKVPASHPEHNLRIYR